MIGNVTIKDGMDIIFNNTEIKMARVWVDDIINAEGNEWMRTNFQDSPEKFESTIFNAYCGEMAFGKMSGLYPQFNADRNTLPQDFGENGWLMDIKTIISGYQFLDCNEQQIKKKIDMYVLMIGEIPRFVFKGWATKKELFSPENRVKHADIRKGGYGFGYMMHFRRLTKTLWLPDYDTGEKVQITACVKDIDNSQAGYCVKCGERCDYC